MRQTGFFHHIGSFLLLSATILLIITCISAPVVHNLSMLKVVNSGQNDNNPAIAFGTFGYCVQQSNGDGDVCSGSHVGYHPSTVIQQYNSQFDLGTYAADTSDALTKVMVLHPVACALSFIAFLMALGAGIVGSFMASLVALLTFLVTLVVLITDFVGWSIIKSAVNNSNTGATAEFGAASWTLLVSAICNLLATIIVFFTCCSARLHSRRGTHSKTDAYDAPMATTTTSRRRWF